MKYLNAAEVLPEHLLCEIQKHVNGEVLYIPALEERFKWGEKNGSKKYYEDRNKQIKRRYQLGHKIEDLSQEFGLAYETVRKIIYKA